MKRTLLSLIATNLKNITHFILQNDEQENKKKLKKNCLLGSNICVQVFECECVRGCMCMHVCFGLVFRTLT